jgi:type II secretory pathway pseudopilin PulG
MKNREQGTGDRERQVIQAGEQGYMLLGLIVAIALILLALSVAASKVAFSLRREREVEAARRADQYVRAIRRFYLKNGHYPGSLEQLDNTNNVRYLRQKYVDPLTGKPDWRLIGVGKNKTTVKGFFGEPLAGLATTGIGGGAAGTPPTGVGGVGGSFGGVGAAGAGASAGATPAGGAAAGAGGATGTATAAGAGAGQTDTSGATGSTGAFGSQSATSFGGSVGAIMGVGSSATGNSVIEVNQQTTYQDWEFLYDPRIEALKQKAALNSGVGSSNAGSIGQLPGAFGSTGSTGATGTGTSGTGTAGTTGTGTNGAGAPGGTPPNQP